MKIDDIEFKLEFCCSDLMNRMFELGVSYDWSYCPYCGKEFKYTCDDKAPTVYTVAGDPI